jgi:adenine-specific DNA-methyltransferase
LPVDLLRLNLRTAHSYGAESGNLLIRGENLIVMRALIPVYAGQVKLVYIDPPFNTGGRFDHYHDDLSSETWLAMMEERLPLLRDFLRPDGVIFVHLDGAEMAYCKAAMDRILGRDNYLTTIVVQSATPSSFKTVNPGPVDVVEYILMYCHERASYRYEAAYVPCANVDLKRFSRYITNPADPPAEWRFAPISQGALAGSLFAGGKELEKAMGRMEARAFLRGRAEEFALANAERVFETKTLQRPGRRLAEEIAISKRTPGVIRVARTDRPDLYLYRADSSIF